MIQLFQTFHSAFFYISSSSPKLELFPVFPFVWWKKYFKDSTWRRMTTHDVICDRKERSQGHCGLPVPTELLRGRRWMIVINQDRIQSAVDQKPCSDYIIMRACRRGEDWSRARGISWRCAAWIIRRPDAFPGRRVRVTPARGAGRLPSTESAGLRGTMRAAHEKQQRRA